MIRTLGHAVVYHALRPVVRRTPHALAAAVGRATSVPLGLAAAARSGRRAMARDVLRAIGRSAGLPAVVAFCVAQARERFRQAEYYLYDGFVPARCEWAGGRPAGPCIYVCVNRYGLEAITSWLDQAGGVVVRRRWDGEVDPAAGGRWRAHQAAVRTARGAGREVIVGDGPMAYRQFARGDRSVVVYQDVWSESFRGPPQTLLGRPAPLPLGALRIAKLAGGLPVRFLSYEQVRGTWVFRASDPIDPTPAAVAARLDAEVRRCPAAWSLWGPWLEYWEARDAVAATAATPAARPAPIAAVAPGQAVAAGDANTGSIEPA